MNAQQHLPVDDLAAYAAGDLDASAAVAVEAHLVLCADCRSDVDALHATAAALASVERPAMPTGVAARIDAALAAERAAGPAGNVLPMLPKRRRPSFAGMAAVAAGIALVAAISVPFLRQDTPKNAPTAAGDTGAHSTRRLASGLDYTHATLATTLDAALGGTREKTAVDAPGAATGGIAPGTPAPTPLRAGEQAPVYTSRDSVVELQADTGRYAACVSALAAGLPEAARVPLVVDFARFAGKPALLVAFPTVSQGEVRADKIDVFVVGSRCGVTAGDDDVLDFARLDRPSGL